MSSPMDPDQRIEIRDAAGRIVGYFLPAPEYTARSTNGQPPHAGSDQPDWQRRCQDLTVECEKLRKELNEAKAERDEYLHNLHAMVPPMTEEELREIERDGVTFDQVLEDLKSVEGT